jgi:VIT1/CCC1 family predicted Fe2+/Mn2+ transporter
MFVQVRPAFPSMTGGSPPVYRGVMTATVGRSAARPAARPAGRAADVADVRCEPRPAPSRPPERTISHRRLNALRAAVLGVNDGIVSIAALVVGAAGASSSVRLVLVAGTAGLVSGALSMAAGEYVSVSAQRDAERTMRRGRSSGAPRELTSAWHAAFASLVAFFCGGLVPLVVALTATAFAPRAVLVPAVFTAVVLALVGTGLLSARSADAPAGRAVLRTVVGGSLAMAVTYAVGTVVGVAV